MRRDYAGIIKRRHSYKLYYKIFKLPGKYVLNFKYYQQIHVDYSNLSVNRKIKNVLNRRDKKNAQ